MTVIIPPRISRTGLNQLRDPLQPRGNALRESWQVTRRRVPGTPSVVVPGPQSGLVPDPVVVGLDSSGLHRMLTADMVARIQVVDSNPPGGWDLRLDGTAVLTLMPPTMPQVVAAANALVPEPRRTRPGPLGQRDWIVVYFAELFGLDPNRHQPLLDLLDIAANIAMVPTFELKGLADIPRPEEVVEPAELVIDCPWHASWPSGHATAAYTTATLLGKLTGAGVLAKALAHRIAKGREAALVHTSLDSDAGKLLGEAIGDWLHLSATTGHASHRPWATLWELARASLP